LFSPFEKLYAFKKQLRLFMIVRHIFEISDDHPSTTNQNGGQIEQFIAVQIAGRNYYSRPGLTPGRRFMPWLGDE
jgi:DNA gyrase inhibitor GyrI